MTSRSSSPLTLRTSSPATTPATAAKDSGATETTRAAGVRTGYGGKLGSLGANGSTEGAPRRAPRLLRRGRDGDQGARVDGAGVRAARVLLPRDRAQPARGRPLPRAGRDLRRRRRSRAARRAAHALRARFPARG